MSKRKGSPSNKYGPKKPKDQPQATKKRVWNPDEVEAYDKLLLDIIDGFEIDEKAGIRDDATEKHKHYKLIAAFNIPLFKMARLAVQTEIDLVRMTNEPDHLKYAKVWHDMMGPIIDQVINYAEQRQALEEQNPT